MTVSPNTLVSAITLHLGDRTLVLEATPLAKSRQTRLGIIVDQPQANRLELKQLIPRWARWALAFLLIAATTPILTALVFFGVIVLNQGLMNPANAFILCLLGLPVLASCTLLPLLFILGGMPPAVFSRQHLRMNVFRTRFSWLARTRIVAVQLLPGRADEDLAGHGPSIQLNLLLDHAAQPRVGFITFRNAEWIRGTGRKLADYLGVPLVDQIPQDE